MLASLLHRGIGNWEDIAKVGSPVSWYHRDDVKSFDFFVQVLVNKTPEQCRDHFERVYIENASGEFADDWNLGEENAGGARRLVT